MYGAANEVTGSCYLVQCGATKLLVDCGMFQGSERLERHNRIPDSLDASHLHGVILTHGHLDHCGRLPLLIRAGFCGPIYATEATVDIASLILFDAAKIQEDDNERENRKRRRLGQSTVKPLFTRKDVEQVCRLFTPINYNKWNKIGEGFKFRLVDAGHILGSSCVDAMIEVDGCWQRVVFSGDLGQWDVPIMRDPEPLFEADLVFVESTYGNRNHRSFPETLDEFEQLIKSAVECGGKILIPTFAVGRTQQILYHLARMFRTGVVPHFPVYLDSPMAIAATQLYNKHWALMDEEAEQLQRSGQLQADLVSLRPCQTAEESKALNDVGGPCVIMAGAGMCNAGRILHHFRHNLGSPKTVVLIVGYQAKGSTGRQLLEGATEVKILGETIHVKATVRGLGGFSAHGDRSDLVRWLKPMMHHHPRVVLTHGESNAIIDFAHLLKSEFDVVAEVPKLGDVIQI